MIGPSDPHQQVDLRQALADTAAAVAAYPRRPIFEATYRASDVLIRADLLIPQGDAWHMAEVKASTSVKDYHPLDVAIQTWVLRSAGIKVATVELRHIDKGFVYGGHDDYTGLFRSGDVQEKVEQLQVDVPRWIENARSIATGSEPVILIGPQCTDPFDCPFQNHCTEIVGPRTAYPVNILPSKKGKVLAAALAQEGYVDLRAVPAERIDDPELARIREVTFSGVPYLDVNGAKNELAPYGFPRFAFDFETIEFGVPIWPGTRPYRKIPFQWSCHIERAPGVFEHKEFLDLSGDDPSRACVEALLHTLESAGPIFAYNAGFERGVLRELGERFSDLKQTLDALSERFVDLLPIVRRRYYHPAMGGSRSLKDVLPTIAPSLDYEELDGVHEGRGAAEAFLAAIAPETTEERKNKIAAQLLAYCGRDTWAVIVLLWYLDGRGRPPRDVG
jgi:hypothetical protein